MDFTQTIKDVIGDVMKDVDEKTNPLVELMQKQTVLLTKIYEAQLIQNNKLTLILDALDDSEEDEDEGE